ncbi:MAG: hypothetical protein AAGI01_18935 [Myxococcota bacterium]
MQRTELTKKTAKYKGFTALGSATATVLLTFLSPYFLVLGVPMTLWFVFRWLQYRAKWGLRF